MRRTRFTTSIALTIWATTSLSCNPPKSRAPGTKRKPPGSVSDNRRAPTPAGTRSPGGAELPPETPRAVLEHVDGLATSPRSHTDKLIAMGSSASPAMAALAKSDNIAEATSALRFFAATGFPQGAPVAAARVDHPVPSLRHQALLALARCGTVDQLAALEPALTHETDGTTRSLAIRAVAAFGAPESVERLLKLLDDSDVQVTIEVAVALRSVGQTPPSLESKLMKKATSPEVATAIGALTALRLLKTKAGVPYADLQAAFGHVDEHVASAALRLAPRLTGPKSKVQREKMVRAALADKRPALRRVALEELARVGLEGPSEIARRHISDPDPEVSAAAVAALDRVLSPDKRLGQMIPLLSHRHAATRQSAVTALGAAGEKAATPLIARLALERDPMTRVFIARQLGKLKSQDGVPALIEILEDRNARAPQKTQARDSLRAITGKKLHLNGTEWRQWLESSKPAGG